MLYRIKLHDSFKWDDYYPFYVKIVRQIKDITNHTCNQAHIHSFSLVPEAPAVDNHSLASPWTQWWENSCKFWRKFPVIPAAFQSFFIFLSARLGYMLQSYCLPLLPSMGVHLWGRKLGNRPNLWSHLCDTYFSQSWARSRKTSDCHWNFIHVSRPHALHCC